MAFEKHPVLLSLADVHSAAPNSLSLLSRGMFAATARIASPRRMIMTMILRATEQGGKEANRAIRSG